MKSPKQREREREARSRMQSETVTVDLAPRVPACCDEAGARPAAQPAPRWSPVGKGAPLARNLVAEM